MTKTDTKQRILAAAQSQMLANGYAATRVDEICQQAGVSKGSFYHFFSSKEQLAVGALEAFYLRERDALMDGEFMLEADPARRALGFLEHVEKSGLNIWRDGCLLGSFAMDGAAGSEIIGASLESLFAELSAVLEQIFEPFARKNVTSGRILARHFLSIIEGSIVLARARNDWSGFPEGIHQFRNYIELVAAR